MKDQDVKLPLRKCLKCGLEAITEDELSLFTKSEKSKYGRANRCSKCHSSSGSKYDEKNVRHRAKVKYGITLEEYQEAMKTSNKCEICGKQENLCYDHNHNTMKFRGVLCRECNRALGLLGDNIEGLEIALNYLKE